MSNEDTVRRYSEAVAAQDHATAEQLRHPDWVCDWPQSGERVTSSADIRAIVDHYPGGGWRSRERRTVGSEDEFVVTPAGTVVRVAGAGDVWTTEWVVIYPDGSEWYVITILELRDGRVRHETAYFAPPFEAPDWRRDWVELLPPG